MSLYQSNVHWLRWSAMWLVISILIEMNSDFGRWSGIGWGNSSSDGTPFCKPMHTSALEVGESVATDSRNDDIATLAATEIIGWRLRPCGCACFSGFQFVPFRIVFVLPQFLQDAIHDWVRYHPPTWMRHRLAVVWLSLLGDNGFGTMQIWNEHRLLNSSLLMKTGHGGKIVSISSRWSVDAQWFQRVILSPLPDRL